MTLKYNRAPLLWCFKLCASFQSHGWIQTGVTIRRRPIWVKSTKVLAAWPWNLGEDLEEQYGTPPKHHQALCIISSPYVHSNWSYGPETSKSGFDLCSQIVWGNVDSLSRCLSWGMDLDEWFYFPEYPCSYLSIMIAIRKSKDYLYGIWLYKVLGIWNGYYRVKNH